MVYVRFFHPVSLSRKENSNPFTNADSLLVELIGYAARCASGKESPNWTLGPYITQSLLLLVAPALFAATIYMELGRIISLVNGESHCLIRKKWLTKIFVFGDILSFFLQGGGMYRIKPYHCWLRSQSYHETIANMSITSRWRLSGVRYCFCSRDRGTHYHRRALCPARLLRFLHRGRCQIPPVH